MLITNLYINTNCYNYQQTIKKRVKCHETLCFDVNAYLTLLLKTSKKDNSQKAKI